MTVVPPAIDRDAGMRVYATPGERRPGRIRSTREDFRVDELFDVAQIESERKDGYVPVYSLRKSGTDTLHASQELSEALKSKVNFAGLKDSDAITTQYASARSSRAADPPSVRGRGFEAERVGYLPRPIFRGMIAGNVFRIVVRTGEDLSNSVAAVFGEGVSRRLPNFFGYQRFGLRGMVNQRIGRAVIMRDFREALRLLLSEPRKGESPEAAEARRLAGEGRYAEAVRSFSPSQDIERRVASHLSRRPDDYLGGFRRIPILPRRLMVQSYQSYLCNLTLSAALTAGLQVSAAERGDNWAEVAPDGLRTGKPHGVRESAVRDAVPLIQLIGYAFRDYGSRFDRLILSILESEGVAPSAFYVKEAEEVSNEGGFRPAPLLVKDTGSEGVEGGIALHFALARGEYATTLLREVLKPEDPLACGF